MVGLLLRQGADEAIVSEAGWRPAIVFAEALWVDNPSSFVVACSEEIRKLILGTPAQRTWRRRGYLVMCRAYPTRVRTPTANSGEHGIQEWVGAVTRVLLIDNEHIFCAVVGFL